MTFPLIEACSYKFIEGHKFCNTTTQPPLIAAFSVSNLYFNFYKSVYFILFDKEWTKSVIKYTFIDNKLNIVYAM